MPGEEEEIEKLLRNYAEERKAGAPVTSMSGPVRQRLQQEVARQFAAEGPKRRWEFLPLVWPGLAVTAVIAAVIALTTHFLPVKQSETAMNVALNKRASREELGAASKRELDEAKLRAPAQEVNPKPLDTTRSAESISEESRRDLFYQKEAVTAAPASPRAEATPPGQAKAPPRPDSRPVPKRSDDALAKAEPAETPGRALLPEATVSLQNRKTSVERTNQTNAVLSSVTSNELEQLKPAQAERTSIDRAGDSLSLSQNFARVSTLALRAAAPKDARASGELLKSFTLKITGATAEVVEGDGSVYRGSVLVPVGRAAVAPGTAISERRQRPYAVAKAPTAASGSKALQPLSLEVRGVSVTLGLPVVITGQLNPAMEQSLNGRERSTVPTKAEDQKQKALFQGKVKVGSSNEFTIQATSAGK